MFFEELLFPVNQGIDVVGSELKSVPVRDSVRWTCFDAVSAENAARIIDVVDTGVAFPGGDALGIGVFSGFNINAIRRAGRGAKKASNALFQAGFVAVQHVDPTITGLKVHRFEGIVLRDRFTKHIPEGHAESLNQRAKGLADFSKDGCHESQV